MKSMLYINMFNSFSLPAPIELHQSSLIDVKNHIYMNTVIYINPVILVRI